MHPVFASRRAFVGWSVASFAAPAFCTAPPPLRIVYASNPGYCADATAHGLAQALRVAVGREVLTDNKLGDHAAIGAQEVLRAAPDGNTVLLTTGAHTTHAVLMRTLADDPLDSFTPIAMVSRGFGWVLAVGSNSPHKTLAEFVDAARKAPKQLSYGSSGIGGSTHVMAALFCKAAGIELTHIPCKGTPVMDLISGAVDASFQPISSLMEMFRNGRLRPLGVSSDRRLAQLPDVPTFKEFGIDANLQGWTGIFAPAGTPPRIVDALYRDMAKAGQVQTFQDQARASGTTIVMLPPPVFSAHLAQEMKTYRRILPPLRIQLG